MGYLTTNRVVRESPTEEVTLTLRLNRRNKWEQQEHTAGGKDMVRAGNCYILSSAGAMTGPCMLLEGRDSPAPSMDWTLSV